MLYCSYSKTDDICPKTPHPVETMGQRKNWMNPKIGNEHPLRPSSLVQGGLAGKAPLRLNSSPSSKAAAQASSQPASEQVHRGNAQDSEKVRVLRQGYHRPKFGGCWMCPARGGHRAFSCHSPQRTMWRTGGVEGCRQWLLNCWTKHVCLPQTSGWSSKQMPGLLSHFGSGFSYLQPNALEQRWHSSVA